MRPRTHPGHLPEWQTSEQTDVVRKKLLALATAGAGGDLQPLLAVAARLRQRGHDLAIYGSRAVASAISGLGVETVVSRPELDLAPRFTAAREETISLPVEEQGREVGRRLLSWGDEVAADVLRVVTNQRPEILISSLFGALFGPVAAQSSSLPWVAINSTFYFGTRSDRRLEDDFAPRTLILFRDFFLPSLESAALVLHATDQHFDFDCQPLPPKQHYVGPLLWELPEPAPTFLDEPGLPWVLIALSSDPQDDVLIARLALRALAATSVRVLVTIGAGHDQKELEPIPANARVEHQVPHGPVLERALLMVGHAGHGSVMKALWRGVPMVLVPWTRDQPGVAARAERLGVAKVVRRQELSEESLRQTVREVMADSGYRKRAALEAERLQTKDPAGRAAELIEAL